MKLEELESAVLSQAQMESAIASGERDAKWHAIEAGIVSGSLPLVDFPSASPELVATGVSWSGVTPLHTLLVGLAIGGAGGWAARSVGQAQVMDRASPQMSATVVHDLKLDLPEQGQQESQEFELSGALSDASPTQGTRKLVPAPSELRVSTNAVPAPAPKVMSFHEELAYLQRAQGALRRGEPALALGLMLSLNEMPSGGALLSERQVTQVLALCALGRTNEAQLLGKSIFERSSGSPYAERLRQSCVFLDEEIKTIESQTDSPSTEHK